MQVIYYSGSNTTIRPINVWPVYALPSVLPGTCQGCLGPVYVLQADRGLSCQEATEQFVQHNPDMVSD